MKRNLLSQMRNEWRANIWLIVELAVVSVVVWASAWLITEIVANHYGEDGYSTKDVYTAEVHFINPDSEAYTEYPDSLHNQVTDLKMLMANLRAKPQVEVLGIGVNANLYQYNYSGNSIHMEEKYEATDSVNHHVFYANTRRVSPEIPYVYKMEGPNGTTSAQLSEALKRGEYLVSTYDYSYQNSAPEKFMGKEVMVGNDSSLRVKVGGIAYPLRRTDYEPSEGVLIAPLNENEINYGTSILLRVRPGQGQAFIESLKNTDKKMGNAYIVNFESFEKRRPITNQWINQVIRYNLIMSSFLMMIIFIGFLGTFWFRTQERTGEIAIRKACGATDGDIMRRFLGEGMLMLGIASVIAIGLDILFLKTGAVEQSVGLSHTWAPWVGMGCTLILTTLIVGIGIILPARKAMKTDPASALKDQ